MLRELKIQSDEPLIDGLIAAVSDNPLPCEAATVEGPFLVLKLRRKTEEAKPAIPATVIQHGPGGHSWVENETIAETVRQPRADLLVQEEPPGPMPAYGKALGELMDDPSTKDVARLLIAPLLERGLKIKGNPSEVLKRIANTFKKLSASKLSFAAQYLLKGKHELFPDNEEIYAAIGRYEPAPRTSASDPAVHVNGAHA